MDLSLKCSLYVALGLVCGGCTTSRVHIDPVNVTQLTLRTATPTFCPGAPLKVDLLAQMNDGTTCTTFDPKSGCTHQPDALLDTTDVRIEGPGKLAATEKGAMFIPDGDALATAEAGIRLRAWLEQTLAGGQHKSPVAETQLLPDYACAKTNVFGEPPAPPSQPGAPGPDIKVAITTIKTPFVADGLLLRVESKTGRTYVIASGPWPIAIISKGGNGGDGPPGRQGSSGAPGPDGSPAGCESGKNGQDGGQGANGGDGGTGGVGGKIEVLIDAASAELIKSRIQVASFGGDAGKAGPGGLGGQGGQGGTPSSRQGCASLRQGQAGKPGSNGVAGVPGKPGLPGPPPVAQAAPREQLFQAELPVLQKLEGAAKK